MPYDWPEDTDFALWELDVTDRNCPSCGRMAGDGFAVKAIIGL